MIHRLVLILFSNGKPSISSFTFYFLQMEKNRLRELLLYEFRKGSTTTQAHHNICQTEGEGAISYSTVKKWFKQFKEGNEGLKDEPRSGRPPSVDSDALQQAVEERPGSSTRQLAAEFGCSNSVIAENLHKLGFVNKKGTEVPHALSQQQKNQRVTACNDLLARLEAGMQLRQLITCDEKWVYLNNKTAERQWLKPGEHGDPIPKRGQHAPKLLLCVWWSIMGVIHFELLPDGATINSEIYQEQLQRVQQKIRTPQFAANFRGGVLFLQDNARPHISNSTMQKIKELGWQPLPHPAYSPDLSPSDYHLFRSLEHFLRGKEFFEHSEVEKALKEFFSSKNKEFYARGIESLPERWEKVIENNGDYFID